MGLIGLVGAVCRAEAGGGPAEQLPDFFRRAAGPVVPGGRAGGVGGEFGQDRVQDCPVGEVAAGGGDGPVQVGDSAEGYGLVAGGVYRLALPVDGQGYLGPLVVGKGCGLLQDPGLGFPAGGAVVGWLGDGDFRAGFSPGQGGVGSPFAILVQLWTERNLLVAAGGVEPPTFGL